jgi:hypothetical protein
MAEPTNEFISTQRQRVTTWMTWSLWERIKFACAFAFAVGVSAFAVIWVTTTIVIAIGGYTNWLHLPVVGVIILFALMLLLARILSKYGIELE